MHLVRKASRFLFWGLVVAIAFATLSPSAWRPRTGHVKLERMGSFFCLGAALAAAYPRRWPWTLGAVTVFAAGLEMAQTIDPGRHARVSDAMEKIAGGAAGVLAVTALAALVAVRGRGADAGASRSDTPAD